LFKELWCKLAAASAGSQGVLPGKRGISIGYPTDQAVLGEQRSGIAPVSDVLRLLGEGATGAILLALSDGPVQTKVLTHRVRGYTARTIYRYLPRLARLGVVERNEEPDGSAKVLNTLTPAAGSDLCAVVERFARASGTRLPGGQVEPGTWGTLGLLADLWETGMVDELSRGPRSPTDLVQIRPPGQSQGGALPRGRVPAGDRALEEPATQLRVH